MQRSLENRPGNRDESFKGNRSFLHVSVRISCLGNIKVLFLETSLSRADFFLKCNYVICVPL